MTANFDTPSDEFRLPPRLPLALGAMLILCVIVVYAPAMKFGFLSWDDADLVTQNSQLNPPTIDSLSKFWTAPYAKLYTPLSYSLWWLVAKLHGSPDSSGFHALNILLHAANCALVFSIVRWRVPSAWPAFFGAALFALHPLQVENVAWVSEMNSLLAALLSLGAIRVYLAYANRKSRGKILYLSSSTLFILALLAKPTAVVVPVIAAVIVCFAVLDWRQKLSPLLSWLLLASILVLITHRLQSAAAVSAPPFAQRPFVALDALGFYLRQFFWPVNLTVDYARKPAGVLTQHAWITPTLVVGALAIVLYVMHRRLSGIACGLAIASASLFPVLGLVPFDFQRYSTVADRYMYLPMLGFSLAVAWLIAKWPRTLWLIAPLIIALVPLTTRQLPRWRDSTSLANATIQLDPLSTIGNKILASDAAGRRDWPDAVRFYQTALIRNGDDGDLHYNLANALRNSGDLDAAIDEYETAIPQLEPSLRIRAMNNLGVAYLEAGHNELAEAVFMQILQIDPKNADARKNLGVAAFGVPSQ